MTPTKPTQIESLSTEELQSTPTRELIIIASKDGAGKSSAIIALAMYVGITSPDATFFIIDTENKIKSTVKAFGSDAPRNLRYFKTDTMNEATLALSQIVKAHKPGDWLGVESAARLWERAQDLATLTIAGVTKAEYLERRIGDTLPTGIVRKNSPIPDPEDYWKIAKGAHDGAFFDLISSSDTLNTIISTTVTKPRQQEGKMKESVDRKAVRVELGIDVGLDGAPRLPYLAETMALLELTNGSVKCRILRDNNNMAEVTRVDFDVPDKKAWGMSFYENCRG